MKKSTGYLMLRDPRNTKGTVFTKAERRKYKLEGLLPDGIESMETQILRIQGQLKQIELPIHKYIYLSNLLDINETLFFRL